MKNAKLKEACKENLECYKVADVTDTNRLVMKWRGKTIVDMSRAFLDTNGVRQHQIVDVCENEYDEHPFDAVNSDLNTVLSRCECRKSNWFGRKFGRFYW